MNATIVLFLGGLMKKIIAALLTVAFIFTSLAFAFATPTTGNNTEHSFKIVTARNEPIAGADVYLYSFSAGSIIDKKTTNVSGMCTFVYQPAFNGDGSERIFEDYIAYVYKAGYGEQEYNFTGVYTQDETSSRYVISEAETHIISIPESQERVSAVADSIRTQDPVYRYLVEESKLSPECPFYVLKESDYSAMALRGIATPSVQANNSEVLINRDIPVGEFHTTENAIVNVKFTSSNSLKVQVGVILPNGTASYSGTRTRGFSTTTVYPEFTAGSSYAEYQVYNTKGDYEKWETSSYYGGVVHTHYGLKQINGGTSMGGKFICSTCNKPFSSIKNNSCGHYVPINNGGSWSAQNSLGSSYDVGVKASLPTLSGTTLSLGVTITGLGERTIEIAPKSGYNLYAYDNNSNWKVLHISEEPA